MGPYVKSATQYSVQSPSRMFGGTRRKPDSDGQRRGDLGVTKIAPTFASCSRSSPGGKVYFLCAVMYAYDLVTKLDFGSTLNPLAWQTQSDLLRMATIGP